MKQAGALVLRMVSEPLGLVEVTHFTLQFFLKLELCSLTSPLTKLPNVCGDSARVLFWDCWAEQARLPQTVCAPEWS